MHSLVGKWVLVTGASRGIGRLIALEMAAHGCNLLLHSRHPAHTASVLEQVLEQGVKACAVAADLADPGQVTSMLDQIESGVAGVDVLFNNAGVQVAYRRDFWHTPIADFETSFQVNCIAPAMICYRLIPGMLARGFGRVVNVTSSIRDEPEQAGYSASKAALDKFTRDLGSRLNGTGVLINLADPGWCRTDLGGPDAPDPPQHALPGVVLGAFVDDGVSGRLFEAPSYRGMSLSQALQAVRELAAD